METLQTMMDAFGDLGGTLIAVIFMLVALLLAGLIVRASRSAEKSDAVQAPKAGSRYDETAEQNSIIKPSTPEANPEPAQNIPESISHPAQPIKAAAEPDLDQVYDAEREAQKAALANPYPTDSVLRRHYETLHNIKPAPVRAEPEVESVISPKASKSRGSIIELAINKDEQATPAVVSEPTTFAKPCLPEDSVLKRHFIQRLQADIVSEIGPKPTDSVLKRHYESVVQQALDKRLSH